MNLTSQARTTLRGGSLIAAAAVFVIGLGIGATIGPQFAGIPAAATGAPAVLPARENGDGRRLAYPAEVLRVVDGDTFEARVRVWPGLDITTKVRLRGVDAAEFKARCAQELMQARAAHDALAAILAQGEVGISSVSIDKYGGRVLANASTRKTADVSAALLQTGLVRNYSGGRREGWCD